MDDTEEKKGPDKFASVTDKLNAPKKLSQFEKARQEAEQKRLREEAEAAAALRDFEDSFAGEDEEIKRPSLGRPPHGPGFGPRSSRLEQEDDSDDDFASIVKGRGSSGPKKADFSQPSLNSQWSRDSPQRGFGGRDHGSFASGPTNLKRKRELEELAAGRRGSGERGFSDSPRAGLGQRDVRNQLGAMDEDTRADRSRMQRRGSPDDPSVRRPTMLLQSVPRAMTENTIRKIMPGSLKVEEVNFLSDHKSRGEDHTKSALVITSSSTPVSEINSIVSQMQNQYLGFGCYLNITRHVSASGGASSIDTSTLSMNSKNPFGAMPMQSQEPLSFETQRTSFNRAAPPSSFNSGPNQRPSGTHQPMRSNNHLQVTVTPPSDIKLLRLIHTTAERLITLGPDFEVLLMSKPAVQHDEKWAWLFDSTSKAGIYYRWLVWHWLSAGPNPFATESKSASRNANTANDDASAFGASRIFSSGPLWLSPADPPKYQSVMDIEDLASHEDYVSSSEDEAEETHQPKNASGGKLLTMEEAGGDNAFDGQSHYLGPYRRAKLTHLLARLPDNNAILRAGDIARVTDFVVSNAGRGAEEIVDMLLCNVENPFCYAVRYGDSDDEKPGLKTKEAEGKEGGKMDMSSGQLIALYVVNDVLLTSASSGVRDAWKYRALFETAIKERKIFERLGRLDKVHAWGRMKGEQWKRRVGVILEIWYSANVFTVETQRHFKQMLTNPPLTMEEAKQEEDEERKDKEEKEKSKWRSVGDASEVTETKDTPAQSEVKAELASGTQTEAAKKIAALKAKLGGGRPTEDTAGDQVMADAKSEPLQPVASGRRRARPTAADLMDAPEETEPALTPIAEPAKPATLSGGGGFGFSLSMGVGGGLASNKASSEKPELNSTSFVIQKPAGSPSVPDPKDRANMFADSDEE